MTESSDRRTWIVVAAAKAAFRLEDRQHVTIVASPESFNGMFGVRLRDHVAWSTDARGDDAPQFVGSFIAEAAGIFGTAEEALNVLGNLATPYFQVMATITNCGVEDTEDIVVYSPPKNAEDAGQFVVQRHSEARAPAARLRKVAAADVLSVLELLNPHPRIDRLMRTMAHFRMALNQLDPMNRVLVAESLWLAIENLTQVVYGRLYGEQGIDAKAPDAKHQLALALGFEPKKLDKHPPLVQQAIDDGQLDPKNLKRDNSHLTALDALIRKDVILGGDKDLYDDLRKMSDGFEHGYMDFGKVQQLSKVADECINHVRRAILREVGMPDDSPLFDKRFDTPQGAWRPVFQGTGTYTDSAGLTVDLSRATFNDPWPDAPGLSLVPSMTAVVDNADGTRTFTLQVNGTFGGLTDTQTAQVTNSLWITPGGADVKKGERRMTTRLNGEVIEDRVVVPGEPEAG